MRFFGQFSTIAGDMWRRRWIGLAVAWLVAVAGAVVLWRTPDRYETTARVYVDTQTVLKPLMAGLAVQPNIDEQIGMLARTIIARPNIEKIMHSANLDVSVTSQIQRDQMVDDLTKRIRFNRGGRENIYTISYQDTNPERSKRVVQDLLSLFVESGLGNKRRDSEAARRFIDEQIKGYEQKLVRSRESVKGIQAQESWIREWHWGRLLHSHASCCQKRPPRCVWNCGQRNKRATHIAVSWRARIR